MGIVLVVGKSEMPWQLSGSFLGAGKWSSWGLMGRFMLPESCILLHFYQDLLNVLQFSYILPTSSPTKGDKKSYKILQYPTISISKSCRHPVIIYVAFIFMAINDDIFIRSLSLTLETISYKIYGHILISFTLLNFTPIYWNLAYSPSLARSGEM